MLLVHQRQTHNNNPFHILSDDDDDDDTVVASNCSPREPPPTLPTSDLRANQPRNRPMRQLVSHPRSPPATCQTSSSPAYPPTRVLTSPATILATAPTAPHVPIHNLPPKPTEKPSKPPACTKTPKYSIPVVEPDDDHDEIPTTRPFSPPRRSTRLISSRTLCSISRQALYHGIGLGFTNVPVNTVRPRLQNITSSIRAPSLTSNNTVMGWCILSQRKPSPTTEN